MRKIIKTIASKKLLIFLFLMYFGAAYASLSFCSAFPYDSNFNSLPDSSINTGRPTAYALIVGIEDYSSNLNDLKYCVDDLEEVRQLLVNEMGYLPENIYSYFNLTATSENLDSIFSELALKMTEEDTFFFYFAGGGDFGYNSSGEIIYNLESAHNYVNYEENSFLIHELNVDGIRAHFSRIDVEEYNPNTQKGDLILIGDESFNISTNELDSLGDYFTGSHDDVWSNWVLSDTLNAVLYSDESITDWGFEIDKYETCTLNGSSRIITNEIQINDVLTEVIQKNENKGWGFQLDEHFDNLPCKEIYTIFDSSFSGGFINDLNQSNRVIITGTEYNGTRLEDAESQNGIFTHQFLRAFERTDIGTENIYNNADIDQNGLTWNELFDYLCLNTLINPQYCNQISENSNIRPKPSIISSTPFGSNHFEMELLIEGTNHIKEFIYDLLLDNNSVISEVSNLNLNFGTYIISYNDSLGPNIIGYIVSVTYANNMTLILMNSSDLLDTDSDNIPDSIENVIGTSISNNDTDNDDLDDNIEISVYGTEPLNNDTDNDQLIDGEEILIYGTSTFLSDCDDDGLSDYEECIKYSTNPYENDTDQDGFDDLFEVLYFTDPLDYNSNWKIILNYIVITAVIIGVAIMVALSLVRYVNKPANYASSSISIKNKSPNYSKKVKLKQNSKYISPNVRQLAKIIPHKLNSPEGKIGFDYFEKAVYKERTGKEHEALNYYIKALKSGVPEPYNTQIRKKYDIPLIQKKTKLYKTNLIEFEDELESECHYCEICHGIMKKEGRFLICSSCGEKFLL